jgi:hypothetical protein
MKDAEHVLRIKKKRKSTTKREAVADNGDHNGAYCLGGVGVMEVMKARKLAPQPPLPRLIGRG